MAWSVEEAYTKACEAIRARIVAQWKDGSPYRTAIQFSAPIGIVKVDGTVVKDLEAISGLPWLKLDVVDVTTDPFAYCKDHGTNRNTVIIYLTVYSPRDSGENEMFRLAGLARVIFSRKHIGDGLRPEASSLPRRLPDENNCFVAQITTTCHFYETVQQ